MCIYKVRNIAISTIYYIDISFKNQIQLVNFKYDKRKFLERAKNLDQTNKNKNK